MKKRTFLSAAKNPRGFSIIESVIAMGILTMIALGAASLISDLMKLNRNIMATSEANSTMTLLAMYLSDQATCDLNLVTLNTVQFDVTKLKDLVIPVQKISLPANGSEPLEYLYNTEKPVTNGAVKISGANLSNITYINLTSQSAKLNITFDKGPQVQGPQYINRSLFLKLESTAVSPNILKVSHCLAGGGTIMTPAPTPLPDGTIPETPADIPDALFKNLLTSVKATLTTWDKVDAVKNTIASWQSLGLIGKGRYISIAKFSSLVVDGGINDISGPENLCKFLSGHVIDQVNAVNTIPIYRSGSLVANECAANLAK